MTDRLKPGNIGPATDPTQKPAAFKGSMAEAMEDELNLLLGALGRPQFATGDNSTQARDRRMVLVAIARGVVTHLSAHQAAFEVKPATANEHIDIATDMT